jgi:hypothetical protein
MKIKRGDRIKTENVKYKMFKSKCKSKKEKRTRINANCVGQALPDILNNVVSGGALTYGWMSGSASSNSSRVLATQ